MDINSSDSFNLHFPGNWIKGEDHYDLEIVFSFINNAFEEAIIAFEMFTPLIGQSPPSASSPEESNDVALYFAPNHDTALMSLYAKAFVYSLNTIDKLLPILKKRPNAPQQIISLSDSFHQIFGYLKHIRDSLMHLEHRGLGLNRKGERIESGPIRHFGSFAGDHYFFMGEDGETYNVKIATSTLQCAREIIQNIINAYEWE